MIGLRIDSIHANGVSAQLFKIRYITLASIGVGKGILETVGGRIGTRILLFIVC